MVGGGKAPKIRVPGPSPAQEALAQEQLSLLREQRDILHQQLAQQNLLAPVLLKSAGIVPITDASGKTVGFKQTEDPLAGVDQQIRSQLQQRTLAALQGKLPDNPALLSDLARQEETLNEQLRKQLGTGYQISSPGSRTLADFFRAKEGLLEAARRGDITTGEALNLSSQAAQQQALSNFLQRTTGVSQFQFSNPGMNLAQSFGAAQAPFLAQQQMGFNAAALNAQLAAQQQSSFLGGLGQLGGLGLFAPGNTGSLFGKGIGALGSLFGGGAAGAGGVQTLAGLTAFA